MLRKLFSILILLIYIPAVAGVGFSTHYCWGEPRETKVFSVSKQGCCCEADEEEQNGCCSDEIRYVKLDNDQQHNDHRVIIKPVSFELFHLAQPAFLSAEFSTYEQRNHLMPVPLLHPAKKNILHCSWLI